MITKSEKSFNQLLQENSGKLGLIVKKSQQIQQLNTIFQRCLPPLLQHQCQVANYRDQCLVLAVSSAAWATRLRFHIPELIQQLIQQPQFSNLLHIDYYIDVPLTPASRPIVKSSLYMSRENVDIVEDMAQSIEDENLRLALMQLAESGKGEGSS